MTLAAWHEEPVSKSHNRKAFDCGDAAMNDFLQRFARQSHEQNASKTFCAIDDAAPSRILGFYTVAPSAVAHDGVPAAMARGLARNEVSGFKLARLATDIKVAGQGLGGQLLASAALPAPRGGRRRYPPHHRCQERAGRAMVQELWSRTPCGQAAHFGYAAGCLHSRPQGQGPAGVRQRRITREPIPFAGSQTA